MWKLSEARYMGANIQKYKKTFKLRYVNKIIKK